jgi:hypothetical protein
MIQFLLWKEVLKKGRLFGLENRRLGSYRDPLTLGQLAWFTSWNREAVSRKGVKERPSRAPWGLTDSCSSDRGTHSPQSLTNHSSFPQGQGCEESA